jgi:NADH-quinone oxidoreductase subunit I
MCAEACPTLAIQMTTDFEMSEPTSERLVYEKEDLLIDGPGKHPGYSYWAEAGVAVTHAMGQGKQDRGVTDPRSNLP